MKFYFPKVLWHDANSDIILQEQAVAFYLGLSKVQNGCYVSIAFKVWMTINDRVKYWENICVSFYFAGKISSELKINVLVKNLKTGKNWF